MKTKIPSSARSKGAAILLVLGCLSTSSCTNEEIARWSIAQVFDVQDQDTAVRVARCESGFDPEARSPGNWGVFQINDVNRAAVEEAGIDWERVRVETMSNTLAAKVVLDRQGWKAWSCK